MRTSRAFFLLALCAAPAAFVSGASCGNTPSTPDLGPPGFHVEITSVNGNPLPSADKPLPPNSGTVNDNWGIKIEARTSTGDLTPDFNGWVRLTLAPGTVAGVTSTTNQTNGRDILLTNGQATGVAQTLGAYGPARLWVEDLGYVPAPAGMTPLCANGVDDNGNGLIDYPADPGCYYADDNTEDGGTYAAGVSPPVPYSLPTIPDIRGKSRTPYPNEAIEIATDDPHFVVVTRISSAGFFVTDVSVNPPYYNSLYAYNFSTPPNMRVCDRITQLGGTANDFYGFTELSFPTFNNTYQILGLDGGNVNVDGGIPGCQVPEPIVLDPSFFTGDKNLTAQNLYKYEASLVRLEGFTIAKYFGAKLMMNNVPGVGASNCDFNGDGVIDYTATVQNGCLSNCEGDCSTICDGDPDCTEWTEYASRAEVKVAYNGLQATMIKINASTVGTFDPVAAAGSTLPIVTGSLTEFSGGTLNWTVEVRCQDDLVCPAGLGCVVDGPGTSCPNPDPCTGGVCLQGKCWQPIPINAACVRPRTLEDNDEGTD